MKISPRLKSSIACYPESHIFQIFNVGMSDNDEGRQPMILQYVFILPGSYIPCLFPCALFDDIFPPSLAPCFLYEFYKKKTQGFEGDMGHTE